jgi:hypothetical protein
MDRITRQQVKDLIAACPVNHRERVVCPSCGGGTSKERSLSVRRTGMSTGYAKCYRGTCFLGTVSLQSGDRVTTYEISRTPTSTRRDHYDGTIVPVPPALLEVYFGEDWRLSEDNRLVIPIRDAYGLRKGDILRQLKPYNDYQPKSVSLYEEGYSGMAWFRSDDTPSTMVCVVEDPLSAARLAYEGVMAVALLGTHITWDRIREISEVIGPGVVHIALDADACAQSVRLARVYRNVVDMRVHRIYNDIKDMDCNELLNFLAVLGV